MQSWPEPGQAGDDGQSQAQWPQNYGFVGGHQDGQLDPGQAWPQPVADDASAYSHLNPHYLDQPQAREDDFFGGHLQTAGTPDHAGFPAGPHQVPVGTPFSHAGPDSIDAAFNNIHPELYTQQGASLGPGNEALHNMNDLPRHAQAAPQQHFVHHDFSFAQHNSQPFEASASPYSSVSLLPQQVRTQSHTPVQQQTYDHVHSGQGQSQGLVRPQQSPPLHQQSYVHSQSYLQPPTGHANQYQNGHNIQYQQTQQEPHQQAFHQIPFLSQGPPSAFSPQVQPSTNQQTQQSLTQPSVLASAIQTSNDAQSHHSPLPQNQQARPSVQQPPHPHDLADLDINPEEAVEPTAKKRKRMTQSATDSPFTELATLPPVQSPADQVSRILADVDALGAPEPNGEEALLLAQSARSSKGSQTKQLLIKGLPHLVCTGTIKLPSPKSYDKLAPLVAPPSRSGQPMIPGLGYDLPCEIQGRFTSQYRPTADKGGLEERRREAKELLDSYDRSMQALGKRRPKYTEYPHAFKEQLKSDEASKSKAEKRAKKELEEERNKPIRTAVRPADPVEAAAWDAVGFVHIDKSIERTSSLIAGRVQQAGDLLIQLRSEMTRAKQELDQATKDQIGDAEIEKLRKEVEKKRKAFYKGLDATIEHADDAVLDNLGGHQKLILSLVNALIACIKAADFSGEIPKAVLELFTHFRMTKKIAETTNFETVRKRFADKGDSEVKELVGEISAKVKKVSKPSEPETATGYAGTSAAGRAKASAKISLDGSSTKRGRDEDSDTRTVKKVAVESGGGSLSKKLGQPKPQSQPGAKTSSATQSLSATLPGRARPVAKTVPNRDSTGSPSDDKAKVDVKRPAADAAAKSEQKPPPAQKITAATSSSALSGIASLLDSINAPRPEAAAVTATDDVHSSETLETSAEKAERQRKEARRKLHVSWKPEAELVQIRLFQKDEGEDEGREGNMIRDAADDRSEGMVLKQRANVDDDEDDEDVPYQPWLGPTATDFSNLPEDIRSKNYVTRGGNVSFETEEQTRMAERELRELMAIYTDESEIPLTPKSPPRDTTAAESEPRTGQFPEKDIMYSEIRCRWQDVHLVGAESACAAAMQRLGLKDRQLKSGSVTLRAHGNQHDTSANRHQPSAGTRNMPFTAGPAVEGQVLAWLVSDRVKTWRDLHPPSPADLSNLYQHSDPEVEAAGRAVEAAVRRLAGKPYPANSPPEWLLSDEEKVREWWFGFNKELAARQKKAAEEQARAEAAANTLKAVGASTTYQGAAHDWSGFYSQQQQAYAPYMAILHQMTGGQQQAQVPTAAGEHQSSIPDSQLQSILAAINQPLQSGSQPPLAAASHLNPNDTSYRQLALLTQMAQGSHDVPVPLPTGNTSSDHDRDRGGNDQRRGSLRDSHKNSRDGKESKKKKAALQAQKAANKALAGTKTCTFWQQGKCSRGDKCTFRHV